MDSWKLNCSFVWWWWIPWQCYVCVSRKSCLILCHRLGIAFLALELLSIFSLYWLDVASFAGGVVAMLWKNIFQISSPYVCLLNKVARTVPKSNLISSGWKMTAVENVIWRMHCFETLSLKLLNINERAEPCLGN